MSRPTSPLRFLGLEGFLKVLFHLRDMSAKFVGIYKRICSPSALPRCLAREIEVEAMGRKHDIGIHAAELS